MSEARSAGKTRPETPLSAGTVRNETDSLHEKHPKDAINAVRPLKSSGDTNGELSGRKSKDSPENNSRVASVETSPSHSTNSSSEREKQPATPVRRYLKINFRQGKVVGVTDHSSTDAQQASLSPTEPVPKQDSHSPPDRRPPDVDVAATPSPLDQKGAARAPNGSNSSSFSPANTSTKSLPAGFATTASVDSDAGNLEASRSAITSDAAEGENHNAPSKEQMDRKALVEDDSPYTAENTSVVHSVPVTKDSKPTPAGTRCPEVTPKLAPGSNMTVLNGEAKSTANALSSASSLGDRDHESQENSVVRTSDGKAYVRSALGKHIPRSGVSRTMLATAAVKQNRAAGKQNHTLANTATSPMDNLNSSPEKETSTRSLRPRGQEMKALLNQRECDLLMTNETLSESDSEPSDGDETRSSPQAGDSADTQNRSTSSRSQHWKGLQGEIGEEEKKKIALRRAQALAQQREKAEAARVAAEEARAFKSAQQRAKALAAAVAKACRSPKKSPPRPPPPIPAKKTPPPSFPAKKTTPPKVLRVPDPSVPVVRVPTAQVAAVRVPTAQVPAARVSTAQVPTAQVPTAQLPAALVPTSQLLAAPVPIAQIPAAQVPAARVPTAQLPAAPVPTAQVPAAQVPAAQVPIANMMHVRRVPLVTTTHVQGPAVQRRPSKATKRPRPLVPYANQIVKLTKEQIQRAIPDNASCVFHILDRRVNLDAHAPDASFYSLLRSWVQDDPYRQMPPPGSNILEYASVPSKRWIEQDTDALQTKKPERMVEACDVLSALSNSTSKSTPAESLLQDVVDKAKRNKRQKRKEDAHLIAASRKRLKRMGVCLPEKESEARAPR